MEPNPGPKITGLLKAKLDNIKMILKKNWDALIIVDGKERSGKSTLALSIGAYIDPNLTINNIAIDNNDAVRKIEKLPPGSVLIVDEGSLMLSGKDAMSKEQKKLLKILNIVGQKNMVFIIVLPSFFALNKELATNRARFLIHCYTDKALNRGKFIYFGTDKLQKLYEHGKKNFGSYNWPRADFPSTFSDYKTPWYDDYLKTKEKTLIASFELGKDKKKDTNPLPAKYAKITKQRDILIRHILTEGFMEKRYLRQILEENGAKIASTTVSEALSTLSR